MVKKILFLLISFSVLCLQGCQYITPGTESYTLPEDVSDKQVEMEIENLVEQKAAEKHVPPELSDAFVQKYLNMKSFNELKVRTKAGIAITNHKAGMTEEEIKLWEDIIATKKVNQFTTEDMEQRRKELEQAVTDMAKGKKQEIRDFLRENYGMSEEEKNAFLDNQVQKYYQPSQTVN